MCWWSLYRGDPCFEVVFGGQSIFKGVNPMCTCAKTWMFPFFLSVFHFYYIFSFLIEQWQYILSRPYHQFMTPKWLSKHATMYGLYTYKPNCLGATTECEHVLQVPLVPLGVLTSDYSHCPSITMTIAMDTMWADSRDHDPHFGISKLYCS